MPDTVVDTYTDELALQPMVDPENARTIAATFVPASSGTTYTITKGTALGKVTASGKMKAYASGNSDGSQVMAGLLQYTTTVDDQGRCSYGAYNKLAVPYSPMWYRGAFASQDCIGVDAAGLASINGNVVAGNLTTGLFRF